MSYRRVGSLFLLLAATATCDSSTFIGVCSLARLDLSVVSASVYVGQSVMVTPETLRAAGVNCPVDQLSLITWSSDDPDIATVSPEGEVVGVSPGTVTISASLFGETTSLALQVLPSVATAVVITPASAALSPGQTRQFTAGCRDSSVMATPCPAAIVWGTTPSPSPTASISPSGLLTANAAGTVTVTATSGSLVGTASVTVSSTVATSISVTPATVFLSVGETRQFSAECRDSNVVATACPAAVLWGTTPSPSPTASISPGGVLTANAPGTVTVRATSGSLTGTASASVGGPSAGSPFFTMNYSAAAEPLAGWTSFRPTQPDFTVTRVDGIGSAGENGYRFTMNRIGPTGGDKGWGHARTFTGAPFTYGDRVYFRWRFRWRPGTNCRPYEQDDSGRLAGVWRNKIIIVNDASSSATSRFIMEVWCNVEPLRYYWVLMKGGGIDQTYTGFYPVTTDWMDVQLELQYSSAAGVTDGAYRIWVNNNTQAAPNAQRTGILLHADVTPGYVQFGAYVNNGVYSDGVIAWEHTGFEIDDDFDPAWDRP